MHSRLTEPNDALNLDHLFRLSDGVGMYQHAAGSRPNPTFGYCVDDNARALIVTIRAQALTGRQDLGEYVEGYLAFVVDSQRPDGRFHNFKSADAAWLDDVGSQDSQGRAVWGLGFAAAKSPQADVQACALECLARALPRLGELTALRAQAFARLGLGLWQKARPSPLVAELAQHFGRCAPVPVQRGWFATLFGRPANVQVVNMVQLYLPQEGRQSVGMEFFRQRYLD